MYGAGGEGRGFARFEVASWASNTERVQSQERVQSPTPRDGEWRGEGESSSLTVGVPRLLSLPNHNAVVFYQPSTNKGFGSKS